MGTRVTIKGQVTIPKAVRDAAGIAPGDEVEVTVDQAGRISIEKADEKAGAEARFRAALVRAQRDPPIKGITTEEIMDMTRGGQR